MVVFAELNAPDNTAPNAFEPPELAVPDTTRSALALCVTCLTQYVGAFVCWKVGNVPGSNELFCILAFGAGNATAFFRVSPAAMKLLTAPATLS
jgi:hypothetical protein